MIGALGRGFGNPMSSGLMRGYGGPDQVAVDGSQYWASTALSWAPVAAKLYKEVAADPFETANVLRAELQSAIARGAPLSQVRELQAKLQAAELAVTKMRESEASGWQWATLGKGTVATIALVAVAAAFLLFARGARTIFSARRSR